MNVIVILTDQHHADFMGCCNGLTRTPALDSLAANGTRFTACYPTSPFCAPSRASMFTGRYPHENGHWDNATPYDGRLPNWPRYFQQNNIVFKMIGKADIEKDPEGKIDFGFGDLTDVRFRNTMDILGLYPEGKITPRYRNLVSHWTVYPREPGEPSNKDKGYTDTAIDWLQNERPSDRPWILSLHYSRPHPNWAPAREACEYYLPKIHLQDKHRQPYDDLHPAEQAHSTHTCGYLKPDEDIIPMHAAYHATVEEVDADIAKVLETLDELGIRDDTLIIYTADHGEMLRAHGALGKMSLYEDSARVPMIVQGPGVPQGQVCEAPVSLLDLYPTVAEAVGVPHAPFARGHALQATAHGEPRPDFAFAESHANGRITGTFMIRTKEWKLIENLGYEPMLFNLEADPQEMNNLAPQAKDDEAIARTLEEMRRRLYSVCSPEAATARANREQRMRREQLIASGRIYKELEKRFCLPDTEKIRLDPVAVEKEYGIKLDPQWRND